MPLEEVCHRKFSGRAWRVGWSRRCRDDLGREIVHGNELGVTQRAARQNSTEPARLCRQFWVILEILTTFVGKPWR
jgi:hypothetical protein